jgi:hypothetical protein
MWTDTADGHQLVGEISKDIVAQTAPEELEMFDELLQEHFQNPASFTTDDEPLGFGGELMVAMTPVVAMVVEAVITFLLQEVITAAKQESVAVIAQKVKAIFNPSKEKKGDLPTLTSEQLKKVKELVRKEALRGGMKPNKAEDVALMITARLALAD